MLHGTAEPAEQITPKKSWITEGIVIAVTPLVAYMLTFGYEAGFASVYRIPISLISLDLTNVLIAMFTLWAILGYFFPYTDLYYMLIGSKTNSVIFRSLIIIAMTLAVLLIPFTLHGTRWKEAILFVIFLAALIWFEVIQPLIIQRIIVPLIKQFYVLSPEQQPKPFLDDLTRRLVISISFFLTFMSLVSFSAGRAWAFRQTEFLIAINSPECVVLRNYGGNLICAAFDRQTREVTEEFRILNMSNNNDLVLRLEEIGPLQSKIASTSSPTPTINASTPPPSTIFVTATPMPETQ
jgi:hypothetical protein